MDNSHWYNPDLIYSKIGLSQGELVSQFEENFTKSWNVAWYPLFICCGLIVLIPLSYIYHNFFWSYLQCKSIYRHQTIGISDDMHQSWAHLPQILPILGLGINYRKEKCKSNRFNKNVSLIFEKYFCTVTKACKKYQIFPMVYQ